ncbi:MAG: sigma-70 family RNA polymerase sigma factor [Bacteroidota bacterium]
MTRILNFRGRSGKLSGTALIQKYQQTGDQRLVVALMEEFSSQITGIAFKYFKDHDDILDFRNDLFVKLVETLREVDTTQIRSAERWLCRLIRNAALDCLRKRNTYRGHTLGYATEREANPRVDRVNLKPLDNPLLHRALQELNAGERICIEKIFFEEMSYQDIMQEHGFTFNQVRGYRDRAIRRLRTLLKDDFAEYFSL